MTSLTGPPRSPGWTSPSRPWPEYADALHTNAWLSMGDPSDERERRDRTPSPYQVDGRLPASAADDAIFMHCLPAHSHG
jgi:ornithine carbamoyltransferase